MTETYRIRSAETWDQARDDYLAGMDAGSVCRRHDLGLSAFRRRAREQGWRRVDQPDSAPDVADLAIYDDIHLDEQAETAQLRFIEALEAGRALEAARWRRLWVQMCGERNRLDTDLFPGMSRSQINALLAEESNDKAP